MSNWTAITTDDLNDAKVAALVDALRSAALADGQTDPTPRVTQVVVDRIRRKIASCSTNRLDADETTIPRGLKDMAVDLILYELKGRLEIPLTEDERSQRRTHESDLDRIASCQDTVEQPDDGIDAPVQDSGGSPSFSGRTRINMRERQDGL